jgi:hypothetical protein
VEKKARATDVLLTHIGVCGASLNLCFLIRNWSVVEFSKSKFKRIYAGHFHCKQQVGENVWYPGSPVAFRFDEGLIPHGFLVYDTEKNDAEFVDIFDLKYDVPFPRPPLYYTVLDEDLDKKPPEFFANNMLRVVLNKDYTRDEVIKLEKKLRERGAVGISWLKPKEKDVEIETAQKSEVDMKAPGQLLELWVNKDGAEGLNRPLLQKLNSQIIAEAEERISVESE